jgi:Tol biopolymer transport system component
VRNHLIAGPVAAAALLVAAPAAQAELVYVKKPNSGSPQVWLAKDDGSGGRRIGTGIAPTISDDGRWVAWRAFGTRERVMLVRAGGGTPRRVVRSVQVGEIRFSPDSTRLGFAIRGRLVVRDLVARENFTIGTGHIRGFSFSPDSRSVVYGTSGKLDAFDAPSDLYTLELNSDGKTRVTRDRKSLNPLWAPNDTIIHDRQTRRNGDAPKYNLFAIKPDGGSLRRITSLRIPPLLSGLVPVEISADGKRLLALFTGQDTAVGFKVNPASGRAQRLSDDFESGFVGTDLTADGRTVLGMTGGADPAARHDVVTIPWGGGKPKVLVRRATTPDWTR